MKPPCPSFGGVALGEIWPKNRFGSIAVALSRYHASTSAAASIIGTNPGTKIILRPISAMCGISCASNTRGSSASSTTAHL